MNWFSIKNVGKNIYIIKERFYKETANMYLIKGKKDLLIDTGTGLKNIAKAIEHLSSNPIVVNTHIHYDHSGGNKFFDSIYIHEKEAKEKFTKKLTASFLMKDEDFIQKPFQVSDLLNIFLQKRKK